jgi:hypothetical protein
MSWCNLEGGALRGRPAVASRTSCSTVISPGDVGAGKTMTALAGIPAQFRSPMKIAGSQNSYSIKRRIFGV